MTTRIAIEGAVFYAYHGFYPEENRFGHQFVVDAEVYLDGIPSDDDCLSGTADYGTLYSICEQEMKHTCRLLETLAGRIVVRMQAELGYVKGGRVKIAKCQPQLGGKVARSVVEVTF